MDVALINNDDYEPSELATAIFKAFDSPTPCRICGRIIGDDLNAVFATYALNDVSRLAHSYCWDTIGNDRTRWAYPEDAVD